MENQSYSFVGKPEIDLFVIRMNNQLDKYVSWHPELEAMAISAFFLNWKNNYFYMFPPFDLVG